MLKPFVKILAAGAVGFFSIIGAYLVLALHHHWLPDAVSNATLMALILSPIPIGLLIAWAVYRALDRITGPRLNQPR